MTATAISAPSVPSLALQPSQVGTLANRPAANAVAAGFLYWTTDTHTLYESDGNATWTAVTGAGGGPPAMSFFQPANPAGTAAAAMMGLGSTIKFTPVSTGNIWIYMSAALTNNTAGDTAAAIGRFGTGAAPANGAAPTGTIITGFNLQGVNGTQPAPVSTAVKLTGLTLNTQIWVDLQLQGVPAGTASVGTINCTIMEVT